MKDMYPIIKVNQPSIRDVWHGLPISILVVRVQDLICLKTYNYNSTFREIQKAGSIHNHLKTNKKIILSSVMRDEIIKNFSAERYIEIIKALKPDFFTTVDGWTYEGEFKKSAEEIQRCIEQTKTITKACPEVIPIGQVKGCCKSQLKHHIDLLKGLGINTFMFHISDYCRDGNKYMAGIGKSYAAFIRKHVDTLILYGLGSQRHLAEYSFADHVITLSYFVRARHGRKIYGAKEIREKYSVDNVRHNLIQMMENIRNQKLQTRLTEGGESLWEEDQVLVDPVSLEATPQAIVH